MKRWSKTGDFFTASGLPGPQAEAGDLIRAVRRKLEEALEEGIEIIDHATVSWLIMKGSKVTGVEVIALRKIARSDGHKTLIALEDPASRHGRPLHRRGSLPGKARGRVDP
ncbi:hypothetical protein KO516_19765 [Citreicella sp. C3M06]|uniref:hypothetical protein n=1 Tax=Citreicella sp. C3M06 TaxID=2841564 RepID=UPI001C0817C3|nr:hypothetical protein [Citreicella sp. C3M06]MBU2963026.1 hypothetical protein [Citreicella sp. C3M06]